jgi:hypothetical protein
MIRLALVPLLALAFTAQAQTYSVPRRLPLERAVKREFREWMVTSAGYAGLIEEQFYPIGWSRDGKFAYYYEPVDEACGCYFANLVIKDMRTDKVVWEFKYDAQDHADPKTGDMPPQDTIAKLWRKNAKLFSSKLREHKIVASPSLMLGTTFSTAGSSYTAKGVVKTGKNSDFDSDMVEKFTFTLSSPKLGTKTLAMFDHEKQEYWFTLDAGVLGVIKSPFEPRVAVIGMEVNRGWEGPPHTGDIIIVGADLTSGFAKN